MLIASPTFKILTVAVKWEHRFAVLDILPTDRARKKYQEECESPSGKYKLLGEDKLGRRYNMVIQDSLIFIQVHAPSHGPARSRVFSVTNVRGFTRKHRIGSRKEILAFKPEKASNPEVQVVINRNFARRRPWSTGIEFV